MSEVTDEILIAQDACGFAFRAGQELNRLLIDRGIDTVRQRSSSLVTAKEIISCLDAILFERLAERLAELAYAEKRARGADAGGSREAA